MIVIGDTNILSSLAAAQALPLLFRLFTNAVIYIPPAVHQELQVGLARGKIYLESILQAIGSDQVQILELSSSEKGLLPTLHARLNAGEREAIALAQTRRARLLCNDKRAIRYCEIQNIQVLSLPDLLRLLWIRRVISQNEVKALITNQSGSQPKSGRCQEKQFNLAANG